MNNLVQRMLVAVALLSCVALVGAQAGGQGGGQGRRGGGQFGQRRGGGNSEMSVVMRADVQKELAITEDQKKKLEELRTSGRPTGGGGAAGGGAAGGNGGGDRQQMDPAEMQKRMAEMREKQHKDIAAILNETQVKRLGELVLQRDGFNALTRAEVQKSLGFTSEQTQKVKDLQTKQQEAGQALREKMRNQELTREEMQAAQTKNQKTMSEELAKILTADQATKFKDMQGKAFTFDKDAVRGGGGGR
jgi:hypothetical protein